MNLTPEGEARARQEYETAQSQNRTEAGLCRYCKAAQTREKKLSAMCRKHRERARLIYATSPISKNYWTS